MAVALPAAWPATGQRTSKECCAQLGSSRSAHDPDIPRPAGNSNAPTRPPKRGCACSHLRDHWMNSRTNSTAGARTTTTPDRTKPCTVRHLPNAGEQAHEPPLDHRFPDQCAPACTTSTKPATSVGATTSSELTAASPASVSSSLPATSPWPSTANKASYAGSPSTPPADTKAPESRPADDASVSNVLTKTVSDVPRHHSCQGLAGSQK